MTRHDQFNTDNIGKALTIMTYKKLVILNESREIEDGMNGISMNSGS